jgi:hypothetical protein
MGKGSNRRPCLLAKEAEQLQWDYAFRKITEKEYQRKRKQLEQENKWWKR